ncbi:MAG: S1C family serine protease [Candidatus Nanohaloarchaea archaeon]
MREERAYLFIFVLLTGMALGIVFTQPSTIFQEEKGTGLPAAIGPGDSREVVIRGNTSQVMTEIFDQVKHSVVSVRTTKEEGGSQGSGFVYGKDGYIVTNQHVVEGAKEVEITFLSGTQREAEIVGVDAYTDLAVLKIDPKGLKLQPLPLGDYRDVEVGQRVLAIGNPFGLSGSMTHGIISQKDRLLRAAGDFSIPNVLQTDAAINPGNSGGPLLNLAGEVIGVNTAISSSTGTFNGVGFAVSVQTVKRVVPQLVEEGEYRHPWIGVSGTDVSPEISKRMGLNVSYGFLVMNVVEGSPADAADVQGGDYQARVEGTSIKLGGDVIVGIDGNKVRQIEDILNYLAKHTSVGETITLQLIRDGKRIEKELTLARRPQPP